MDERSHQENLYVLLRDAKKQKFLGQDNMVVNSGSLLVKRCQQAKKMYGNSTAPPSDNSKEGIRTENATTVCDGLNRWTGSSGMGPTNDGNKVRTGRAAQILSGADGHCKE